MVKGWIAEGHVELALAEVFLEHLSHHDEAELGCPPLRELCRKLAHLLGKVEVTLHLHGELGLHEGYVDAFWYGLLWRAL